MTRAAKGGEIGKNGEFYKGGTFLPSTRLPKRGTTSRSMASGNVMIEPGVIGQEPFGHHAIYPQIRAFVISNDDGGLRIMPHLDSPDCVCWQHYGPYERVQGLVDQYNGGIRFIAA